VTRRVRKHARVVAHHPTTGKGEQMMSTVSVGHPSHPAKPQASCFERLA
jgi:hypothetical protein